MPLFHGLVVYHGRSSSLFGHGKPKASNEEDEVGTRLETYSFELKMHISAWFG
jgi:hypothetical protein